MPQSKPKPVALAKAEADPSDTFGGFIAFSPGTDGVFRVPSSERTWIELLDRNRSVPPSSISSDKRLRCFGVRQSLLLAIKPGCYCLRQVTAAAIDELDRLVAQAAK